MDPSGSGLLGLLAKIKVFASTLTFDLGYGHCLGILSTVDLCRFCVLSLHREVGGVRQYTGKDSSTFC